MGKPLVYYLTKSRNRHFLIFDVLVFLLTPTLALVLRTDGISDIGPQFQSLLVVTLLFLVIKVVVFYLGGLYSRYWRYASIEELGRIASVGVIVLLAQTTMQHSVLYPLGWVSDGFPRSIPLIESVLAIGIVSMARYSVRLSERLVQPRDENGNAARVLIAGAGWAGVTIVREMQMNPHLGLKAVGFVDDDPAKRRVSIRGVPVVGPCSAIPNLAKELQVRQVIIAMPSVPGKQIRRIVGLCEQAGVQTKIMPGMYELLDGTVRVRHLRDVRIEDLLRRDPIQTDTSAIGEMIRGKRILVTGGGGSIGSELCRQLLRFDPESLVILGHGENSVFEIENELAGMLEIRSADGHGTLPLPKVHSVIADIRMIDRLWSVFERHRPEVVFHAAAHKHVPLMELNPIEAITNNVIGTQNLLQVSTGVGVERFVMISSDKAVNPTSVMGASKRAAELLVRQAAVRTAMPYVAVRFGNVLGSRGSVVLSFQKQIAAGGPVTVTHPDMKRYFMTIPEAVQLVLQAATLGQGGEIYMLDMGEPVKIVDLARDLIELSGLKVGVDIDIKYVGIRPGEKLFEELFIEGEEFKRTPHEKIFIATTASRGVPYDLDEAVRQLGTAVQRADEEAVVKGLQRLVPEFHREGHSNQAEAKPRRSGFPQTQLVPAPLLLKSAPDGRNDGVREVTPDVRQPAVSVNSASTE